MVSSKHIQGFHTHQVLRSLVLFLLLVVIYWPGLQGNFIFDDFTNIVDNTALRMGELSWSSLADASSSGTSSPLGRPLAMASFALNYHFFGEAALSFKLTNLVIHFLNAMLIFVLSRQLLRSIVGGQQTKQAWLLATGVALVWALHPINVTPVLLVVQRMTSMGAFFTLAALILYLYGRRAKSIQGYITIAVSICLVWPAAIYSKETGLLLPAYIFLCEWLLLGTFKSISARIKWTIFFMLAGASTILVWINWGFLTAGYLVRDFNLVERLLTESRVLWFYSQQITFPLPRLFGLFHDDIAVSRGLLTPPATFMAIFSWTTVVTLAFWKRAQWPLFAFAVYWFLVSHTIESTVLPLEIAYEHRNYLASFGIFLWLGRQLCVFRADKGLQTLRVLAAVSFILFCGLITTLRSSQWSDELVRSQAEVADHPNSPRANYQAANELMRRTFEMGRSDSVTYEIVQSHYRRASELDARSTAPLIGLLYLDCSAGLPVNADVLSLLMQRLSTTRFTFGDRAVVQSLSRILVEGRLCLDDQQAIALINAGLTNPSADGAMRGLLNSVGMDVGFAKMHSPLLALNFAKAAVQSDPGSVALRVNLVYLYVQSNRLKEARHEYSNINRLPIPARDREGVAKLKGVLEAIEINDNKR